MRVRHQLSWQRLTIQTTETQLSTASCAIKVFNSTTYTILSKTESLHNLGNGKLGKASVIQRLRKSGLEIKLKGLIIWEIKKRQRLYKDYLNQVPKPR